MRLKVKESTARDLYLTMINYCEDELQGIENGDCTERLAEIVMEDYPNWTEPRCRTIAQQFFDDNYDRARDAARKAFEPTAQQEAMADIRREAIYGR